MLRNTMGKLQLNGLIQSGIRSTRNNLRNQSTLVFVETGENGIILKHSQSTLEASKQLGSSDGTIAVVVGSQSEKAIANLNKFSKHYNINKIIYNADAQLDNYSPEIVAHFLRQIVSDSANDISHVLFAASSVGKNVLPRLSASLNIQCINDIVKIENDKTFVRPIYAGNLLSKIENNQAKHLISIRSSAFPVSTTTSGGGAEEAGSVSATKVDFSVPSDIRKTEYVGSNLLKSERPELGSAQVIVSGGRGLKNKENFDKLIVPLADSFAQMPKYKNIPAAIGATRAAVDSGFCDNSLQIGQTGKVVAPELYVACGISGAIQHLAGMKNSKVIVNINKEEDQPLQEISDFTLIGDVNEILPELTKKLAK